MMRAVRSDFGSNGFFCWGGLVATRGLCGGFCRNEPNTVVGGARSCKQLRVVTQKQSHWHIQARGRCAVGMRVRGCCEPPHQSALLTASPPRGSLFVSIQSVLVHLSWSVRLWVFAERTPSLCRGDPVWSPGSNPIGTYKPVVCALWDDECGLVVLDSPVACDLTPVPTGMMATRGLCAMG